MCEENAAVIKECRDASGSPGEREYAVPGLEEAYRDDASRGMAYESEG